MIGVYNDMSCYLLGSHARLPGSLHFSPKASRVFILALSFFLHRDALAFASLRGLCVGGEHTA